MTIEVINASGSVNMRAVMQMAHAVAKQSNADYIAFRARQAHKHVNLHAPAISYAAHLSDALTRAWQRVEMMRIRWCRENGVPDGVVYVMSGSTAPEPRRLWA